MRTHARKVVSVSALTFPALDLFLTLFCDRQHERLARLVAALVVAGNRHSPGSLFSSHGDRRSASPVAGGISSGRSPSLSCDRQQERGVRLIAAWVGAGNRHCEGALRSA
jgi:hypothetical protein